MMQEGNPVYHSGSALKPHSHKPLLDPKPLISSHDNLSGVGKEMGNVCHGEGGFRRESSPTCDVEASRTSSFKNRCLRPGKVNSKCVS